MARAQHIPRTQNRGVEASRFNGCLTLHAHGDVVVHHGGRVGNAQVDEMTNPCSLRRGNRPQTGGKVDLTKFGSLGGAGMNHSHQLYKSSGRPNLVGIAGSVQRVAEYRCAAGGELPLRTGRTSARTMWPRSSRRGINLRPMYPVPPVMKTHRWFPLTSVSLRRSSPKSKELRRRHLLDWTGF